jgi:hypothetical protein
MNDPDNKTKDPLDPLSSVLREHAEVVIAEPGEHDALSATEVLAWRSWFNQRRHELTSSGGRPTNPKWTLKRQIPFSRETWGELEERAQACRGSGQKIAPGQLAAFILEESIGAASATPVVQQPDLHNEKNAEFEVDDPEFESWRMPEPFAGCGV